MEQHEMTRRIVNAWMAKAAVAAICAGGVFGANAAQFWRGTTANPVWDTTTANWASSASATTYSTYQNNTSSSQPYFDAGGAADVTVDADGVQAYVINITGGNHSFSGGPITAQVMDPLGGNLTIFNSVTLSPESTSIYLGYRPRSGSSTVTIGAGGILTAQIVPYSDGTLNQKLLVLTNGTLKAMFNADQIKNNKFTLYFDGGNLIPLTNKDWQFVNSQFLLGPGGVHLQERTSASDCWSHLPGPIGTDVENDGGVWADQHKGYMLLPNFTCTYRGGVHINSSEGELGVRSERNLGAVPDSPTNNIFFLKSGACLVGHGGNGNLRLHPNRSLYLADGVLAKLQTWSGNSFSLTIQGTIGCENVDAGTIEVSSYSGINDNGAVAFCPTDDRTNHLGRLLVRSPAVIGSGTTLLESSVIPSGTGGVNSGAHLNISGSGHLMVTGGVLRLMSSKHVCQSARLTVSGGEADFSAAQNGYEFLHGYDGAATTTIRNGGKLVVRNMRMSGDNGATFTDSTKSVVNVETGGVLCVSGSIYIADPKDLGKKGTLNFNGGMLEWLNASAAYMENLGRAKTDEGLSFNLYEGGMIVTNNTPFYIGVPIQSGAANDGGITKWGSRTFALMGKCTFTGPLTIMQSEFRLGASHVLNPSIAVRVNAGAQFCMNTYSQSLARLEGSGSFKEISSTAVLSVTKAIAPGMGTNTLGTLTVSGQITMADDVALEIDLDELGNSDCLNYQGIADLSKMTLQVNDITKLGKNKKYKIATFQGGLANGEPFQSTNLPPGWGTRYYAASNELKIVPINGTTLIVR